MFRFQPLIHRCSALLCATLLAIPPAFSQAPAQEPSQITNPSANRSQPEMPTYGKPEGHFARLTGNYRPVSVAPVNLTNSFRIESLLRGGNLYLSLQDAIALTLENNLDIELQRYGAQEQDANVLPRSGGRCAPRCNAQRTIWCHQRQSRPGTSRWCNAKRFRQCGKCEQQSGSIGPANRFYDSEL